MAENEPRTHARQPGGTPERGEAVRRRSESSESSDDEAADRRWHEKKDMHFVAVGGAFEVEETMFRTGFRGAATPRRSSVAASRRRRGDDTDCPWSVASRRRHGDDTRRARCRLI